MIQMPEKYVHTPLGRWHPKAILMDLDPCITHYSGFWYERSNQRIKI